MPRKKKFTTYKTGKSSNPSMTKKEIHKLITKKAYELWNARGRGVGYELDNWLDAERIVRGKIK